MAVIGKKALTHCIKMGLWNIWDSHQELVSHLNTHCDAALEQYTGSH